MASLASHSSQTNSDFALKFHPLGSSLNENLLLEGDFLKDDLHLLNNPLLTGAPHLVSAPCTCTMHHAPAPVTVPNSNTISPPFLSHLGIPPYKPSTLQPSVCTPVPPALRAYGSSACNHVPMQTCATCNHVQCNHLQYIAQNMYM